MKSRLLLCFTLMFLLNVIVPVSADKLSDVKNQKSNIDRKANDLSEQIKQEEQKLKSAEEEKIEIEKAKKLEKQEYERILNNLDEIKKDIDILDQSIKESEEDYNQKLKTFKKRLRIMYQNAEYTYMEVISESENLVDMLGKLEILSAISKKDKELIQSIKEQKTDIEYKKSLVEEQRKGVEIKANETLHKINQLSASENSIESEIKDISTKLRKLDEEEEKLIKKSMELSNTIRNLTKKSGVYAGGSMTWPCPSSKIVTSYYGYRIHPILKTKKMHTGIDIPAASGASIVAANSGVVRLAGWQSGYGYTVVVDHGGGISTLYAHCSRILVSDGDKVKAGETIAKIGSTGLSTGPHLHFEVRKNGDTTDPMKYYR